MRYDTEIFFVKEGEEEYDATTGDYNTTEPVLTSRWVNVSDMGVERMQAVFGRIKAGSVTINMQGFYDEPYDYIEIGDSKYTPSLVRKHRRGTTIEAGDSA